FNAVVGTGVNFNIVECGTAAYGCKAQTIELATGLESTTAVADGYVAQYAGVVGIIITAVISAYFERVNAFQNCLWVAVFLSNAPAQQRDTAPQRIVFRAKIEWVVHIIG